MDNMVVTVVNKMVVKVNMVVVMASCHGEFRIPGVRGTLLSM